MTDKQFDPARYAALNHEAEFSLCAPDEDPVLCLARLASASTRMATPFRGGEMVWRIWGDGPPLMLAHGSHGSWRHWALNITSLARDWTLIVPDLPGFGDSDLPAQQDHEAIAEALFVGLSQIAGTGTAVDVAAFSMGGVFCAELAARFPAVVRRLVLIDTGGLGTPLGDITLTRVKDLEGEEAEAAHRRNLAALMLSSEVRIDPLAVHIQATGVAAGRLKFFPLILPHRLLDALERARCEVHAIWGAMDATHPNPPAQEQVLRTLRPDMTFRVIPAAGHWVMYERPAAFETALRHILAT